MRRLVFPFLLACGRVSLGSSAELTDAGGAAGLGSSSTAPGAAVGGATPADAGGRTAQPALDATTPYPVSTYPGPTPPSCSEATTCGVEAASCCEARRVPAGTFSFGLRDATSSPSLADVSELWLDTFEVTLARYRRFATDYDRWRAEGNPVAGAGAHPDLAGSGWRAAWTAALPVTSAELQQDAVLCRSTGISTWASGVSEAAINCITWYEAFAFCVWDGGRLPMQAEWEYAAVGGSEQRVYPWGSSPEPTDELAAFGCLAADADAGCASARLRAVGSHPLGAGRWGQQDLAGSVSEWLVDPPGAYPASCSSCSVVEESELSGSLRIARGGSWADDASELVIANRGSAPAAEPLPLFGVRCARDARPQ